MQVNQTHTRQHFLKLITDYADRTTSGVCTVSDFKGLFDQVDTIKRHFYLSDGAESPEYQLANSISVLSNLLPSHFETSEFSVLKVCQSNPALDHWLKKMTGHREKIEKNNRAT